MPGSVSALRKLFPHATIVFHVIDFYPAFRGAAVRYLERDDYTGANHVVTIGHSLQSYVVNQLGINPSKVSVLGQGVDLDLYKQAKTVPNPLVSTARPRAIWTGVLDKADPSLFREVAAAMAALGGSFILAGTPASWIDNLRDSFPQTVQYVGTINPADLPSWLMNCDIGVMLYDRARQEVYKGQNPLKLYEYAAAGLPILSTPHDEYTHLNPPVIEVNDEAGISDGILGALNKDLKWNERLATFASEYSWREKVKSITATYVSTEKTPTN